MHGNGKPELENWWLTWFVYATLWVASETLLAIIWARCCLSVAPCWEAFGELLAYLLEVDFLMDFGVDSERAWGWPAGMWGGQVVLA